MNKRIEELYLECRDLTEKYEKAHDDLSEDAGVILLSSLKNGNGQAFGTAFIGGKDTLVMDSIVNAMLKNEQVYLMFKFAVKTADELIRKEGRK